MNTWSPELYAQAMLLAADAHKGQTYGGALKGEQVDYLYHISCVTMEVLNALQHTDEIVDANLAMQCAILHDTIEDTAVTPKMIEDAFGLKVLNGVLALTKDETMPSKAESMTDSLARIKQQPAAVGLVKMADRVCNLYHPPYYWNNAKIAAYREEAKKIHAALHEANAFMAQRLADSIENYKRFMKE